MAAVEVTITGLLYDKWNRTTQNVVLIGEATLTGLGVGGGPMPPGPGGGQPPGSPGAPQFPIYLPPGAGWLPGGPSAPGGYPPSVQHPIVLPDPPVDPPPIDPGTPPDTVVKPPPDNGGWGYVHPYGWAWFPGPTQPGPKG